MQNVQYVGSVAWQANVCQLLLGMTFPRWDQAHRPARLPSSARGFRHTCRAQIVAKFRLTMRGHVSRLREAHSWRPIRLENARRLGSLRRRAPCDTTRSITLAQ